MDEGQARRLTRAGAGVSVLGAFLLLLGVIFRGLAGPNWRPVMAFGLAVMLCGLAFLAFLLIRQRMILRKPGIREYKDWFGSATVQNSAAPGSAKGDAEPDAPSASEKPRRMLRWRRRLRRGKSPSA